jgi:hypothetical protein
MFVYDTDGFWEILIIRFNNSLYALARSCKKMKTDLERSAAISIQQFHLTDNFRVCYKNQPGFFPSENFPTQ